MCLTLVENLMSVCSKDTKKKKKEKVKVEPAKKPVVKVKNPNGKVLTEEQVGALQNR